MGDNVVDFLPNSNGKKTLGQKLMESERMVVIYESRWWRESKWVARLLKLSLQVEILEG